MKTTQRYLFVILSLFCFSFLHAQITTEEVVVEEGDGTTMVEVDGVERLKVTNTGINVNGSITTGSITTGGLSMWPVVRQIVNSEVAIGSYVDINTGVTWGASFGGILTLQLVRIWNAGNRRLIQYNLNARAMELDAVVMSDNSIRSGPTVSLSVPSNGVVRVTNTSGQPLKVSGWYDWVTAY